MTKNLAELALILIAYAGAAPMPTLNEQMLNFLFATVD